MNILAIDTASALCAACVYDSGEHAEKSRAVLDLGKGHAEFVLTTIGEALGKAGLSYDALHAIAVSVGPGSFTGVRVGVAAARGLALALKIPAIGVTTLEALAAEARESFPRRPVLAVIGRTQPFSMALFDGAGISMDGPRQAPADELVRIARAERPVLAGDMAAAVAESAGEDFDMGPMRATADILYYARIAASRPPGDEKPKPLYLRAPDAKPQSSFALPLKGG